jgi:hypothetical protein
LFEEINGFDCKKIVGQRTLGQLTLPISEISK